MRCLFTLAAVLSLTFPALACVNSSELMTHEREFRSQYQESEYQPPAPEPVSSTRPYVLGGTGVLLALAGAGVLLRLRGQAR